MEQETIVGESVDRLVKEIDRAVALVEQMRREKSDLEQKNRELQTQLDNQEKVLLALRSDRDRLQTIYEQNSSLIENKEEIQRKIETMISRLDSVNTT